MNVGNVVVVAFVEVIAEVVVEVEVVKAAVAEVARRDKEEDLSSAVDLSVVVVVVWGFLPLATPIKVTDPSLLTG